MLGCKSTNLSLKQKITSLQFSLIYSSLIFTQLRLPSFRHFISITTSTLSLLFPYLDSLISRPFCKILPESICLLHIYISFILNPSLLPNRESPTFFPSDNLPASSNFRVFKPNCKYLQISIHTRRYTNKLIKTCDVQNIPKWTRNTYKMESICRTDE